METGLIGKYVIVRCRDAGVHAGVLKASEGRSAILTDARRLHYWQAGSKSAYLSGVANHGLASESKIGESVSRIVLSEDCEIIECTEKAEQNIRGFPAHKGTYV